MRSPMERGGPGAERGGAQPRRGGTRRAGFAAAAIGVAGAVAAGLAACTDAHGSAQAGPAPVVPHQFQPGEAIEAQRLNENFAALEQALALANARIAELEGLLTAVRFDGATRTLVLTGVNLQLRNGQAATASADGTGNLILGHNEASAARPRTGSHNLVVGEDHVYTASGGLAVGAGHTLAARGAVALGGTDNRIEGERAVVVGGARNRVGRLVPGGQAGDEATVVGAFDAATDRRVGSVLCAGASDVIVGEGAARLRLGESAGSRIELGTGAQGGLLIGAGSTGTTQIGPAPSVHVRVDRLDLAATQQAALASPAIALTAAGSAAAQIQLDAPVIGARAAGMLFLEGDSVRVEATGGRAQVGSGGLSLVGASHCVTRADFIQIEAVGKPVAGASVQIRSKDQLDLRGADVVLAVAEDTGHTMFLD